MCCYTIKCDYYIAKGIMITGISLPIDKNMGLYLNESDILMQQVQQETCPLFYMKRLMTLNSSLMKAFGNIARIVRSDSSFCCTSGKPVIIL